MKKHIDNKKIFDSIEFDRGNDAVSHTEMTGLMPSLADTRYKSDSYREIINYRQRPIVRKKQEHTP